MNRLAVATILTYFAVVTSASAASGTAGGMFVGYWLFGQPACGQPHVEVSTPSSYLQAHGTGVFDTTPEAWADADRCVIVINPEIKIHTAAKRCHVIVHEWGHLAGREHSKNPRSVMYGEDIMLESREHLGHGRSRWGVSGVIPQCKLVTQRTYGVG